MADLAITRAIHVLGVVIWIGGVSLATLVLFPAIRQGAFGQQGYAVFTGIERRFVWIARAATLAVGASGFFLLDRLDLWSRFALPEFWWLHAMVATWAIFVLLLFVGEPLILHRYLDRAFKADPQRTFAILHGVHAVLLGLALLTIAGAVMGSHGISLFGHP